MTKSVLALTAGALVLFALINPARAIASIEPHGPGYAGSIFEAIDNGDLAQAQTLINTGHSSLDEELKLEKGDHSEWDPPTHYALKMKRHEIAMKLIAREPDLYTHRLHGQICSGFRNDCNWYDVFGWALYYGDFNAASYVLQKDISFLSHKEQYFTGFDLIADYADESKGDFADLWNIVIASGKIPTTNLDYNWGGFEPRSNGYAILAFGHEHLLIDFLKSRDSKGVQEVANKLVNLEFPYGKDIFWMRHNFGQLKFKHLMAYKEYPKVLETLLAKGVPATFDIYVAAAFGQKTVDSLKLLDKAFSPSQDQICSLLPLVDDYSIKEYLRKKLTGRCS
jgi:hypothetical protein